jgi:high-affinity Fe2+/Pb2+ permease
MSKFLIHFIASVDGENTCTRENASVSSLLIDHVGRSRVHGIGVLAGIGLVVSHVVDGLLVLYLLLLLSFLLQLICQWLFIVGIRWIELVREYADKDWNEYDGQDGQNSIDEHDARDLRHDDVGHQ